MDNLDKLVEDKVILEIDQKQIKFKKIGIKGLYDIKVKTAKYLEQNKRLEFEEDIEKIKLLKSAGLKTESLEKDLFAKQLKVNPNTLSEQMIFENASSDPMFFIEILKDFLEEKLEDEELLTLIAKNPEDFQRKLLLAFGIDIEALNEIKASTQEDTEKK
jgi:hypothetical protein